MDTLWDASPADPPRESHPGGCNLSADLPALSPNREHVSAAPRTPSLYSFLHCSPIIQRKERPAAATESRPCENAAPATAASSSPSTPPPLEIPVSGIETEASSVLSISSPSRSQQSPFDSSLPSPLVPEIAAHYADGMQHPPDRFDDGGDYLGALDFVAESMENTGAGGGKPLPSPSPGGARDGIRRAGSAFGSSANTTTLGGGLSPLEEPRQSVCRHGQIGAFSTYQRFVPGSRPLVSDNWRSKAGTDDASKPEPSPLAMGAGNAGAGNDNSNAASASPITPGGGGSRATGSYASPHGHARAQSRSAVLGTPSRSPLAAPANQNLAGFGRAAVQAGPSQTLGEGAVAGRGGFGAAASPLSAAGYSHAGTGAGITGTPNNIPAGTTADNPPTTPSSRGRMGLDDSGLAEHMSLLSMDNAGNADTNAGDVVLAEQMTRLNIRDNAPSTAAAAAAAADVTILHAQLAPDTLGYCFVRPDGARTRLVPVDMLPVALRGIPARETGDADTVARLVELPVPRGIDAAGRSSNLHRLVLDGSQLQVSNPFFFLLSPGKKDIRPSDAKARLHLDPCQPLAAKRHHHRQRTPTAAAAPAAAQAHEGLLRQVGARGRVRLHAAGVQVQARDAARRGHAARARPVPRPAGLVPQAAGRAGPRAGPSPAVAVGAAACPSESKSASRSATAGWRWWWWS